MKCEHCGCSAHCGQSCTECWECPDCYCKDCDTDEDEHTNIITADVRD